MFSFEGVIEFVAVAETHGFTAAAKQLGCSTSHVSRQIARLEERLGCALLARTTRLVSLTHAGTAYYQQCRDLVVGLQQANEQVSSQQFQLSGSLRVSAAGTFAEKYVAPALIDFAEAHPELSVTLDFDTRHINFVEDGYDFAVRYGRLDDSGLVARKLVDREVMAVASRAYLKKHGEPKRPEHLKNHSCLVTNNPNWTFEHQGQTMTVRVRGRWRSNNGDAIVRACQQGLGIAYLPKSNFDHVPKEETLVPVLKPYWRSSSSSWIVYQNRRFLPLRARFAIDHLLKHFESWRV